MNDAIKPLATVWIFAFVAAGVIVHPAAFVILLVHAAVLGLFFGGLPFDGQARQISSHLYGINATPLDLPGSRRGILRGMRNSNVIIDDCGCTEKCPTNIGKGE